MINNLIEQIKDSEKKSKEIIQEAKVEYSEIIEQAYLKSENISSQAKAEAMQIIKDAKIRVQKDAEAEIKDLTIEYQSKNNDTLKKASLKENDAIDSIIKKVLD